MAEWRGMVWYGMGIMGLAGQWVRNIIGFDNWSIIHRDDDHIWCFCLRPSLSWFDTCFSFHFLRFFDQSFAPRAMGAIVSFVILCRSIVADSYIPQCSGFVFWFRSIFGSVLLDWECGSCMAREIGGVTWTDVLVELLD
jgi:hypothetical protein